MAIADTTRYTVEVLSKVAALASVTSQGAQAVTVAALAATTAELRAVRFTMTMGSKVPAIVSATSQGAQAVTDTAGLFPAAVGTLQAVRYAIQTLKEATGPAGVTSQGAHIVVDADLAAASSVIGAPRFGFEVLARRFVPLSGFTVPAGLLHYNHNWVDGFDLESSYLTDVAQAAETVSEDRRQLQDRPRRTLSVAWTIEGVEEVDAFLVELRRYNKERMGLPLYVDASEVTQTSASAQTTLWCNTRLRRFFANGVVAIVEYGVDNAVLRVQYKQIRERLGDHLVLTTNLDWTAAPGRTAVFPLLFVHKVFEIGYDSITEQVFRVHASFEEVYGPTALPPLVADIPANFYHYLNIPIFDVEPNWGQPLRVDFIREGGLVASGRGQVEDSRGERHRVHHGFDCLEERARTWDILSFFDSRRGRLRSFWLTDRENLLTPLEINYGSNYVSVMPLGDYTAFTAERGHIGITFSDGVSVVREVVTMQNIAGTFRITLDTALPAGYTASDIVRIGRARLTRFKSDTLAEKWATSTACSTRQEMIELLEEKDVSFS